MKWNIENGDQFLVHQAHSLIYLGEMALTLADLYGFNFALAGFEELHQALFLWENNCVHYDFSNVPGKCCCHCLIWDKLSSYCDIEFVKFLVGICCAIFER